MISRSVTSLVLSPVAACAARCRRMLDALGRLGKRRIRALRPSAGVAVTASAFSRTTRALRLLALLELRVRALLIRGPVAPTAAGAASPEPERLDDREPEDRPERPERLRDYERPDRETFPTFDLDKLVFEDARPLTEIVAAICRDFGLSKDATLRAQAPFAEFDALMRGEPAPPKPARRASMDRARPRAPFLRTSGPSDAKRARVDARGPKRPP